MEWDDKKKGYFLTPEEEELRVLELREKARLDLNTQIAGESKVVPKKIALSLLKSSTLSREQIAECTGLSLKEVLNLSKEINK